MTFGPSTYRKITNRNTPETTYLKRLNVTTMFVGMSSPQRLEAITAALDEQRANRRSATESYNLNITDRNIQDLEEALERATANEEARTARLASLEAEEAAKRKERDDAALAALTDQLRTNFLAQPGATEADFEKALPRLLERQREDAALNGQTEFDRQLAESKRRLGNLF